MAKGSENKRDGASATVQNREQMQRINFLHQAAILVASAAKGKVKREKKRPIERPQDVQRRETNRQAIEAQLMSMLSQPQSMAPAAGSAANPLSQAMMMTRAQQARDIVSESMVLRKKKMARQAKKKADTLSVGRIHSRSSILGKTQQERNLPAPDKSLSSVYVKDIRAIARKSVLRIDPNVKRTLCRTCNAVLIPGVTSSVRIKPSGSHVHRIRTTCLACGVHRTIPCPPLQGGNGWIEEGEEASKRVPDDSAMRVDENQAAHASEPLGGEMPEDLPQEGSAPAGVAGKQVDTLPQPLQKSNKAKPANKKKRKRNLDDLVPGTRKQYAQPRFHEKKEHVLYRGYEKVQDLV